MSSSGNQATPSLRAKLEARAALIVPGAANALSARIAEDLGFEAIYVTGAGVTNMSLGMPDLGFISLDALVQHTAAIRDAVQLPIMVDCDTGFGNALNVYHTVRRLERAGANALQFEDQIMPKKCGHFAGKGIISTEEMRGKIRAACDARRDQDLLIVARTDARAIDGFEAAVERAEAYTEAGADVIFLEAPESIEEVQSIPKRLSAPQIVNMVVGGRTPIVEQADLAQMGFGMVLYANAALQGAIHGMQRVLSSLRDNGRMDEGEGVLTTFEERQRLVGKPFFDQLNQRYAAE